MNTAYLLLGGNIGDRKVYLQRAFLLIQNRVGTVIKKSGIYVTAAWGNEQQPDFYNQALCVQTKLSPSDLLKELLSIEEQLGRKRTGDKWQERTMDIDILFYDEEIIDTKELKIPHPFLQDRKFVLVPMMQIAKDLIHPIFKKTIGQLLMECKDELEVKVL